MYGYRELCVWFQRKRGKANLKGRDRVLNIRKAGGKQRKGHIHSKRPRWKLGGEVQGIRMRGEERFVFKETFWRKSHQNRRGEKTGCRVRQVRDRKKPKAGEREKDGGGGGNTQQRGASKRAKRTSDYQRTDGHNGRASPTP